MFRIIRNLLIALLIFAAVWTYSWFRKGVIDSSGGWYFREPVILPVTSFHQSHEPWRNHLLGPTAGTLAAEGCAVACAAMVLQYYGIDADPGTLNLFLSQSGGYTDRGWIHWEKAAEFMPHIIEKAYEDQPSHHLIDTNLWNGNPVIIRLKTRRGTNHFVVIVGKSGFDYLMLDPGTLWRKGVVPLKEITPEIQALRFYRRLDGPQPRLGPAQPAPTPLPDLQANKPNQT
jgi:hypothetical protein